MYDIIVIGMGIGGITAGIYAKRAGLKVLLLEKNMPGGALQKINKINNFPGIEEISGPDLGINLLKQVKKLDIPYKIEEVLNIENNINCKIVTTNKEMYTCKYIVIATGKTPKYLGVNNEKDYIGKGISTCATCDGALYKDKDVAVVGNTENALLESLYLKNLCHKIYILNKNVSFIAEDKIIKKVNNTKNIEVINNVSIKKINDENGKINSVILNNEQKIDVEGIFIYIGNKPDTKYFENLNILDENENIIVNNVCETSQKGIYAIGDCIKKNVYQLITASSEGAIAVSDIIKKEHQG